MHRDPEVEFFNKLTQVVLSNLVLNCETGDPAFLTKVHEELKTLLFEALRESKNPLIRLLADEKLAEITLHRSFADQVVSDFQVANPELVKLQLRRLGVVFEEDESENG